MAATAGDHTRQDELHAVDHTVHIDVEDALGRRVVLVEERPDRHDPGVVDQHVDGAQLRLGVVQEARERLVLGHVQAQGDRRRPQLPCGGARRLDVEVADRHAHAHARQRLCRRAPDPARRPGDRGGLTCQDARLLGHLTNLAHLCR